MDLREVERVVSGIQQNLFKNSNSFSIGMLKSHFKGTGLQFKEHQIYNHGDEVRFIDWGMLAKTNTPFVKTFEEERNVEIVVIIDAGPSMLNGHYKVSKLKAAIEITCLLFLLAQKTSDSVHVIINSESIVNLPPKSGREGIVQFVYHLRKLNIMNDNGEINLERDIGKASEDKVLERDILKFMHKRREIVLLSDFINFISLDLIRNWSKRKSLHCFKLVAPLDKDKGRAFSMWGNIIKSGKIQNSLSVSNEKEDEELLKKLLGPHIMKLDLEERYLEDFVKHML